MYCTLNDLITTYTEKNILLLSDRVNKPAVIIDEAVVQRAIDDAAGEINMYLQTRYTLPLPSVPLVLKRIACVLAYLALHTNIQDDHPARIAAKDQRKLLSGLANGELSLGLDSANAATPTNDAAMISPGRNDWGQRW
ncbi:MAG TPA: phage protein Gp36 family protein [Cellvibrio sp.]|nr:phage protein Gp36 family protein [Cellvibrio sp.]